MNKSILRFCFLVLFAILSSKGGYSQEVRKADLEYEVYKIYPPISISKSKLLLADSIVDLNKNYNSSWVKKIISVEISTLHSGQIKKAYSKNDVLSDEQKRNIREADPSSKIGVNIEYIPENNLVDNDPKEIKFSVTVDPDHDAKFYGGDVELNQYFKEKVVDLVRDSIFDQYQLAAVKFTIDEDGHVADVHIFWSSEDEYVDQLMTEAVCNMSDWEPAHYSSGLKVKQDFAFTLGDMNSCVINMLNIREGWPE